MASVYLKGGKWYLRVKDASGRWKDRVSTAKSKTEARRLADDLERKLERQRFGLEALPTDSRMTLEELCEWWLANRCPRASRYHERKRLEFHIKNSALGRTLVRAVTAAAIEKHLLAIKKKGSAPATLNRLRAIPHLVFLRAVRAGVWTGPNPVASVERRKVPRRAFVTLREEEIPLVLSKVPAARRDLFTVAVWTGMRKGELLGLRKTDLDFERGTILIARSYDHDTTEGGRADTIPMAAPIVPVLRRAVSQSPSQLVFPRSDGQIRTRRARSSRPSSAEPWSTRGSLTAGSTFAAAVRAGESPTASLQLTRPSLGALDAT